MKTPEIDVPDLSVISERLHFIFPKGIENRGYLVRDISAASIFVMFYTGAVAGSGYWIRPNQVTKMTDKQSKMLNPVTRLNWAQESMARGGMKNIPDRWYAVDTRESIRDETLRGLIDTGAVIEKPGVPTTSSKPRYSLSPDFAALFSEKILGRDLAGKIQEWQENNLSQNALARLQLKKYTADNHSSDVWVKFPNGETRKMAPGQSSLLSKATIEQFAVKFLQEPAVVFLSESKKKVVSRDDALAKVVGLRIKSEKSLPDLILADVGPKVPLILFVEIVSTDGPISTKRKEALEKIATGFSKDQIAFLTVFNDRSDSAFKKASSDLAWGSFIWFASEPDRIINLIDKTQIKGKSLVDLL